MKSIFKLMLGAVVFAGAVSCSKDSSNEPINDGKIDPSTIASSNLVAYFPMENTEATVTPAGSINGGALNGGASFAPGRRGKAYKGSSALSYLEFNVGANNPFLSMKEFSVSMWVKAPATTSGASIMMQLDGGDSFMGNLVVMRESQAVTDSMDVKGFLFNSTTEWKGQDLRAQRNGFLNDKWFHLVYLYNKTTSKIEFYANGLKVAESTRFSAPDPDGEGGVDQPLLGALTFGSDMTKLRFGAFKQQIAGNPDSWMSNFDGMLDEVRVYNKALTETEIKALYDAELTQIN